MLLVLHNMIQRGVIDNTVKGIVELQLWGEEDAAPLTLTLLGDCCDDIAGTRVSFKNRVHVKQNSGDWVLLERLCEESVDFRAGDITLSRNVQDENNRKCISRIASLEFFVDIRARILIEISHFDFDISEPEWPFNWDEENLRAQISLDVMREHVDYCVKNYRNHGSSDDENEFPRSEWDDVLNRAESRASIHRTLKDKYRDEPDEMACIAYVLGLDSYLEELSERDERARRLKIDLDEREVGLFDYLTKPYARPVKDAMDHSLFQHTTEVTAAIYKQLRRTTGSDRQALEIQLGAYSAVVSQTLATILLVQECEEMSPEIIAQVDQRIKHITSRMQGISLALSTIKGTRKRMKRACESLMDRLESFLKELH